LEGKKGEELKEVKFYAGNGRDIIFKILVLTGKIHVILQWCVLICY